MAESLVVVEEETVDTPMSQKEPQSQSVEIDSSVEDELHSSVHFEMETMNSSSQRLNRISKALEEARKGYVEFIQKSTLELQKLQKNCAKSLQRSKPFYEVYKEARELAARSREAATRYERASQKHQNAKEIVAMAEAQLMAQSTKGDGTPTSLDPAWQETLSDAVTRVNRTEIEKRESEEEHLRLTLTLQHVMERYKSTETKLRKDVRKAYIYYERRGVLSEELKKLKDNIQKLEREQAISRISYNKAMKNLEDISNCIHERRSSSSLSRTIDKEVNSAELQAAIAGLRISNEVRDSDEYIHYKPEEVDSLSASEISSLSQEGEFYTSGESPLDELTPRVGEHEPYVFPVNNEEPDVSRVGDMEEEVGYTKSKVGSMKRDVGDTEQEEGDTEHEVGDTEPEKGGTGHKVEDTEQEKGETEPERGDTERGVGDTEPERGDTERGVGDTEPERGDTERGVGDTEPERGDTERGVGDTRGDTEPERGDPECEVGDTEPVGSDVAAEDNVLTPMQDENGMMVLKEDSRDIGNEQRVTRSNETTAKVGCYSHSNEGSVHSSRMEDLTSLEELPNVMESESHTENTQLANTQSDNMQSDNTQPDNTQSDNTQLDSTQLDSTQLDSTQSEDTQCGGDSRPAFQPPDDLPNGILSQ